jgi:hypothetical protein
MKVRVEVECTPVEARAFMGLPDVTPLNEQMVAEMQARLSSNMAMLAPDELLKNWMSFGVGAQEQFRNLMATAVSNAGGKS